jgi:hypothetical protein
MMDLVLSSVLARLGNSRRTRRPGLEGERQIRARQR